MSADFLKRLGWFALFFLAQVLVFGRIHLFSLTVIAAIQPYYLELYVPRDSADNLKPSMKTLGPVKFAYYIVPIVLVYCLLFYSLEMLTFFNAFYWLMCVVGSAIITLLLIFTLEIGRGN